MVDIATINKTVVDVKPTEAPAVPVVAPVSPSTSEPKNYVYPGDVRSEASEK